MKKKFLWNANTPFEIFKKENFHEKWKKMTFEEKLEFKPECLKDFERMLAKKKKTGTSVIFCLGKNFNLVEIFFFGLGLFFFGK